LSDSEAANKITFDKGLNISSRSVTWSGDVYEPSGKLSGGSRVSNGGFLVKIVRIKEIDREIERIESAATNLDEEIQIAKQLEQESTSLSDKLELLKHHEALLLQRNNSDAHSNVEERIQTMQQQIANGNDRLRDLACREDCINEKIRLLEQDEKQLSRNEIGVGKDKKLNDLKKKLKSAKLDAGKLQQQVSQAKLAIEANVMESEQLSAELETCTASQIEASDQLDALNDEINEAESQVKGLQQTCLKLSRQIQELVSQQSTMHTKLSSLRKAKNKLNSQLETDQTKLIRLQTDASKFGDRVKESQSKLENLLEKYTWLNSNVRAAGLDQVDIHEAQGKLQEYKKKLDSLKKNVNVHVMEMIGMAERRETELKQKLNTVLRDKLKIEETIEKLDKVKEEELLNTWSTVNTDFGKIFADLLPGNSAKLEPVNGRILEGLEVRVQLGKVWKESLTELSGGQRSLIALSLILSLLQFKPAPMYILDEVDAALDLSHTQNIGHLIKSRFTNSQFIIVSLKEGMFTNAHCIFKTKFRDGTSTVERVKGRSGIKST
jgi:structural maintenance of chromosome 2